MPGFGAGWPSSAAQAAYPPPFWRSLTYFNVYRLAVGAALLGAVLLLGDNLVLASVDRRLYLGAAVAYLVSAAAFVAMIQGGWVRFTVQLAFQVAADVVFITLMIHASGGMRSALGLLLLPTLAAAGLIGRGRLALFFASLASMAVLAETAYSVVADQRSSADFFPTGLLCVGYFATAWLAHTLARRVVESEELARQQEMRLASMAQINQLVIQDLHDGVLVLDENGRILQRNSQAERLLGLESHTEAPVSVNQLLPVLGERFRQWQENPETRFDLLRVSATNRLVRTRFVPIKGGAQGGAVLFLEDMSRIQSQAQQLKLAALGRLTANIAHEIRNPLSAISHAAELLLEERGLNPTQRRLLSIVRDNTQRLERMVKEVLQLNRRDRANVEVFKPEPFLRTFVEEFCHGQRVPQETFVVEVGTDRTVCFDRGHLNQVLWNLCSNAWRYCRKAPGSIRLRVVNGVTPNQVCLDVIDDGPGIDPKLRAQLFEPFFTTAPTGTGLGLFIAREICDAKGATLDCLDSDGGAHFRVVCRRDHVKAQRASDAIQR
ncbi:PAS domain-containing protein [Pelomicrobium methylotrophicum]|uniref:histidine kinase n=1 Tax=Pelomicrobium methylotrophicum TaxID=2602750 RepID=A0A5C7EUW3_9PROT|nr:PAS domain-containing protein [Pelomicrobium methylotrophicum]